LYIFSADGTYKQVYDYEIALISEYKSNADCFGYCPWPSSRYISI